MPKPYTPNDKLAQKARFEGYRARSVYKLIELDNKFHLLKPNLVVLDLGAAPGSWLQYTSKQIQPNGLVVGIDLQEISPVAENVKTFTQDITATDQVKLILNNLNLTQVDLIQSDLAPNTTGIKHRDQIESVRLNQAVVDLSELFLKSNGKLIMKIFQSNEYQVFLKKIKNQFRSINVVKTAASRDRSTEVYIIAIR